jgi:hypothetical protein
LIHVKAVERMVWTQVPEDVGDRGRRGGAVDADPGSQLTRRGPKGFRLVAPWVTLRSTRATALLADLILRSLRSKRLEGWQ